MNPVAHGQSCPPPAPQTQWPELFLDDEWQEKVSWWIPHQKKTGGKMGYYSMIGESNTFFSMYGTY